MTTRRTSRGRAPKADSVDGRTALLDAARALLVEHGGSRFSLADVAARSGRNIALVSYYFGGKEQMLLAILNDDEQHVLPPFKALVESDLTAEKKLETHLQGMVRFYLKRPYFNILVHELILRSDEKISDDIANRFNRPIVALHKRLLDQGRKEGVFRDVDPLAFYLLIMGSIDMLFSSWAMIEMSFVLSKDRAALCDRYVRETLSLLMDGVRAPQSRPSARPRSTK